MRIRYQRHVINDDIERGEAAEAVYKIEPSHSHLARAV